MAFPKPSNARAMPMILKSLASSPSYSEEVNSFFLILESRLGPLLDIFEPRATSLPEFRNLSDTYIPSDALVFLFITLGVYWRLCLLSLHFSLRAKLPWDCSPLLSELVSLKLEGLWTRDCTHCYTHCCPQCTQYAHKKLRIHSRFH